MTPKDRFIAALERKPLTGRVPHFELVFALTMETFGKVHPRDRCYGQWDQMKEAEKQLHRADIADVHLETARKYEHSAIFFHPPGGWSWERYIEESIVALECLKARGGGEYFTMIHGDATFGVPSGSKMEEFICELSDNPKKLKSQAAANVESALERAAVYKKAGVLDGFALCADYCLNQGPFLSPAMFDEFVAPYLRELIAGYRSMGFYTIKHSDGNIMPLLKSIVDCRPHAIHSLDPQGGVDIAEIKRLYGDKVCLIGNVNCGLMDTGTDSEVVESTRYALRHGMPGGGYIFSTSNCVYTGMELRRYELILDVWRKQGNYQLT